MRFGWSEWEATVGGAPFTEGRPRGDERIVARDLERLRALTEARPGLRIELAAEEHQLTVENGRFGVHDVEVRRFLDEVRVSLAGLERRSVAFIEVRVERPEALRFRLERPTPTRADAFLRTTGAELYDRFALAPLEGQVLLDDQLLGTFDEALGLGDLGARARRLIG